MKPPRRPGKVTTAGRATREAIAKAKPVLLKKSPSSSQTNKKEGRGGKRAKWDIDYEEGVKYAQSKMPGQEYENFSHEGVRRIPKRRGDR